MNHAHDRQLASGIGVRQSPKPIGKMFMNKKRIASLFLMPLLSLPVC